MQPLHVQNLVRQPQPDFTSEHSLAWRAQAACRGMDTELFFGSGVGRNYPPIVVQTCATCPVRQECRKANDRAEYRRKWDTLLYGYVGGESPSQRAARRRGESSMQTRYEAVVEEYLSGGVPAVSERFSISYSAARNRVYRVRKMGLLPPGRQSAA